MALKLVLTLAEIILKLPKLHPLQRQIKNSPARFKTAACGRRTGKTVLGSDILVSANRGALDGYPVAWFAPSYKYLSEVFDGFRTELSPIIKRCDGSQKTIELITGGKLDFWTLEDLEAGRGRKYAHIVVDEAAFAPNLEAQWQKSIRPTLTDLGGSAAFLSSPNGLNFFKKLFDRGDKSNAAYDPDWQSWQAPTSSNPHIDPKEIEAARKELPSIIFRQEYLAEFLDASGALMRSEYLRYGNPPAGAKLVTTLGVDLAISQKTSADYTAIVVLQRDVTTGFIYIREVIRFRKQFHEILGEIQRMAKKWNPLVIGIEKVQFQAAVTQELLRTTTLPVRGIVPKGDKTTRFMPVLARYEQGLIYHSPELSPEFDREVLAFPVVDNDDQADAESIAYASLDYCQATPTNFSIPLL